MDKLHHIALLCGALSSSRTGTQARALRKLAEAERNNFFHRVGLRPRDRDGRLIPTLSSTAFAAPWYRVHARQVLMLVHYRFAATALGGPDQCFLVALLLAPLWTLEGLLGSEVSAGEVICNHFHGRSPIEHQCHAQTLPAVSWNVAETIALGPSSEPARCRRWA